MKKTLFTFAVFAIVAVFSATVSAQAKQKVAFAKDASDATLKGTVRGYAYRDYIVSANAGQTINVTLDAPKIVPVFSILLPSGDALDAATQSNDFTGAIPANGNYVVRVFLMRAYARRKGSVSNYTLKISIR